MAKGRGTTWGELRDDEDKAWNIHGAYNWSSSRATHLDPPEFDAELDRDSIEITDSDTEEALEGEELTTFIEKYDERIEATLYESWQAGNWQEGDER